MVEKFVGRINEDNADVIALILFLSNNSINFTISYDEHKACYESIEQYLMQPHMLHTREDVEHLFTAKHLWEVQVYPYTPTTSYMVCEANLRMALLGAVKCVKEYWTTSGKTLKTAEKIGNLHD